MPQPADRRIDNAYKECARLTRSASSNFYVAFLSLPNELRRAIYATYAFCRLCDDIVDEPIARRRPGYRTRSRSNRAGRRPRSTKYADSPIFIALEDAIQRFELDKQYYVDVIDGCRMDIWTTTSLRDIRRTARLLPSRGECSRHNLHQHLRSLGSQGDGVRRRSGHCLPTDQYPA